MEDRGFMKLALELARKGRGLTSPNPMVGAVVVKDGRLVGKGCHMRAGGAHAEVTAIDAAGADAAGATLYVTLEPCNHTGRTPPCTGKIITAGIRRVVVAMADPNPDVRGGGIGFLKARGIAVTTGLLDGEAARLNESFVKYVRTKTPFVIVKCAATLDGRIATRTGDARWVTGKGARRYVHRLRHGADGILVGIGTVQKDDPSLTTRLEDVEGKDPVRIILDTRLTIATDARVLRLNSHSDTIIVVAEGIHREKAQKVRQIEATGTRIMELPLSGSGLDMTALMKKLGELEMTRLLIEGGGRVIGSALRAGVVDKFLIFFAPKILGGDDGVPICAGPGPSRMKDCIALESIRTRRFDDDIMIEGYPR